MLIHPYRPQKLPEGESTQFSVVRTSHMAPPLAQQRM